MTHLMFVLLVLSIFDDTLGFSYEYVLPHISILTPAYWQTTKVIAIVAFCLIHNIKSHERIKGTVTDREIKKVYENQGVPLEAITSINGKILYANLFYPDTKVAVSDGSDEIELCIHGKSLVPLVKTRLNQWSITEGSFLIIPSVADNAFIEYPLIGRYFWPLGYKSIDWYIVSIALVAETAVFEDMYHLLLIPLLVLFAVKSLICTGLRHFRKVKILLTENKIKIFNSQGLENSLELSDVTKIEKGIFRVKVIGRNGQVIYLPRGCYLLPELIMELSGSEKPIKENNF
ncbi:hypothetical protein [Anaeroselena agilis]|uniref:Uncharacterized protein n=1 Tax=Anaeroselena agilis TaxID=3063788 RepID=A0ABU3NX76_9FIRM|nr:hypothetical protein [Selenomonadales bacterium 4137-cl]